MWGVSQRIWVGIVVAALCALSPAQGLKMSVQPVWNGLNTTQNCPYFADIENLGGNDNGVLSTSSVGDQQSIEYPVELPTGTKKRVLFLVSGYSEGKVLLRTSSGIKEATIRNTYGSEQIQVGLISDNPSDLIFITGRQNPENNSGIGAGGCTPEDAPDRFFAYDCLSAVVLGDGTERLRDEQVRAIKLYVKAGGVVLFVGGAATSASSDRRWQDLFPTSNTNVITRRGLTERVGTALPGTMSIEVSKGTCLTRGYGLGLASFLSVNPFESPIRESEERKSIVLRSIHRFRHTQVRQLTTSQIEMGRHFDSYSYSTVSTAPTAIATSTSPASKKVVRTTTLPAITADPSSDPFQIKPPSVSNIMGILIIYAIVVVPVNFLVLRKMNKMEWAWISTPVISVIFSGILLNSTIGLYKANATTLTHGMSVVGMRGSETLSFGRSEMFFPRSRSYNLEMDNVESILTGDVYSYDNSSGVNLVDDGRHIIAPNVNTGNLAFKEISYAQTGNELEGLSIVIVQTNKGKIARISNQSRTAINGFILIGPGTRDSIKKTIAAGASLDVPIDKIVNTKLLTDSNTSSIIGWENIAQGSPNKLVVLGNLEPIHVGPKYGEGHPSSQYTFVSIPQMETR